MSEKTRKQYKLPFVTSRPISRNQYCRLTYGFQFSCARSHIYTYQLFMCEPGNIQHTKLYIYTYQLFMCEHGNIQHTKLYISISTSENFSQYAYKLRRASVTSYLCVNLYCHVMHPLTHMEQAAEGCGSARIWSAVCGKRDKRRDKRHP